MTRKRRRPGTRRALGPRSAPSRELAAFKRKVAKAFESVEDRLDVLESEASLADGKPIPADAVWKELGL
jgi:hypothetical protein